MDVKLMLTEKEPSVAMPLIIPNISSRNIYY
jgi:hypothetical protein